MQSNHRRRILCILASFTLTWSAASSGRAADPYKFIKDIPLEGSNGVNCLTIDQTTHRLYVSRPNQIVVVDLATERILGQVTGVSNATSFAVATRFQLGFSADERASNLRLVDLKRQKIMEGPAFKTGKSPRAVLIEPAIGEAYTLNPGDNTMSRYEADDGDFVEHIAMPGKAVAATVDSGNARIECAIEDKNEIAVLDSQKHKLVSHWPTAPGEGPSTVAIDVEHQRVFVGCTNNLLLIMDASKGVVVATLPIGGRACSCVFDAGTQFLVVLNEQGGVTVIHEDSPEKFASIQTLDLGQNVRAFGVDPTTHKIYVGTTDGPHAKVQVYGL